MFLVREELICPHARFALEDLRARHVTGDAPIVWDIYFAADAEKSAVLKGSDVFPQFTCTGTLSCIHRCSANELVRTGGLAAPLPNYLENYALYFSDLGNSSGHHNISKTLLFATSRSEDIHPKLNEGRTAKRPRSAARASQQRSTF